LEVDVVDRDERAELLTELPTFYQWGADW